MQLTFYNPMPPSIPWTLAALPPPHIFLPLSVCLSLFLLTDPWFHNMSTVIIKYQMKMSNDEIRWNFLKFLLLESCTWSSPNASFDWKNIFVKGMELDVWDMYLKCDPSLGDVAQGLSHLFVNKPKISYWHELGDMKTRPGWWRLVWGRGYTYQHARVGLYSVFYQFASHLLSSAINVCHAITWLRTPCYVRGDGLSCLKTDFQSGVRSQPTINHKPHRVLSGIFYIPLNEKLGLNHASFPPMIQSSCRTLCI